MSNHLYKFKGTIISLMVFLLMNAYLIYILTRYISNKQIMSLFILISNEMFLFIGVLFYMFYSIKYETNERLKIMEYLISKREKRK